RRLEGRMRPSYARDPALTGGSRHGRPAPSPRRLAGTSSVTRSSVQSTARRHALRAILIAGCLTAATMAPHPLAATEDPIREAAIPIARLHYEGGGDWSSNPSSMPNWMRGFQERTGLSTVSEEVQIRPDDEGLFRYPIAYMNGHGNVRFSDEDLGALRTWLAAGGFLWADDNYGMDASFRREVKRLYPDHDMFELPNDHPIFHCYYQ